MNLEPIGYIRQQQGRFWIEVNPAYRAAMVGLEGFSHLQLVWWGHLVDQEEHRQIVTIEKPYQHAPDNIGVFATRSPMRPNPVLLSVVQPICIDREQGTIELGWVDAEPDTPLLDIKPYHPCTERVKQCQVPDWCADWPDCYEDSATYDWSKVFASF